MLAYIPYMDPIGLVMEAGFSVWGMPPSQAWYQMAEVLREGLFGADSHVAIIDQFEFKWPWI